MLGGCWEDKGRTRGGCREDEGRTRKKMLIIVEPNNNF
jgi:hypothetical protein